MKLFTVIVFISCYILILSRKISPILVSFLGVLLLLLFGSISVQRALIAINFNVLGIFLGTMILSSLFSQSGVATFLAEMVVNKSSNDSIAFLSICGLSALISSFTENVATVLIVAPIALEIAKKLNTNPVPLLVGVSISANLQGCATMIGDSPSIILAMESGMNFVDFFWLLGKPGIFFAVEIGTIFAFYILWRIFKKYTQKPTTVTVKRPETLLPACFILLMVFSLVFSSFITQKPKYSVAGICLFWALLGLLWHSVKHREIISAIKYIDWKTFFLLIGIFILVGSLTQQGVIEDIAQYISSVCGKNLFLAFMIIVWLSVLISAFVDNIPYTVAMIPVAKEVALNLGVSMYPFLFGLLIGTCLGGNITPIGASCNVVTVGILRKQGYGVKFVDFLKIGLPFTTAAVLAASLFIWFIWL